MAQLTWRNVDAPNFSGVAESQLAAARLMDHSFDSLSKALDSYQNGPIDRQNAILKNQAQTLLNERSGLANELSRFNLNNTKAYEAARPAAVELANKARLAYSLGTPEGRAQGDAIMAQGANTFAAAGFSPQDVLGIDDQNLRSSATGLDLNQAMIQAKDANTNRDYDLAARDLLAAVAPKSTQDTLAKNLRDLNVNPEIMTRALALAEKQGPAIYGPAADPESVIVDQMLQESSGSPVKQVANKIIGNESSGNANAQNPNSTAGGLGQFVDGTWVSTVKKYRPDVAAGRSDDQIIALKGNAPLNRQMTEALTAENADYLTKNGFQATPGNIYLAHFAGQGGASKALSADPNASVASVLGQKAVDANPFLKGWNVGQLRDWANKKMGGEVANARVASAFGDAGTSQTDPASDAIARALSSANNLASNSMLDIPDANDNQALLDRNTSLANQAQDLIDTATADSAFDQEGNLVNEIVTRPNANKTPADIAKDLFSQIGSNDAGSLFADPSLTLPVITEELNRIQGQYGVPADVAAAFLKNAISRNANWFRDDTLYVDHDKVDNLVKQFINPKTGGLDGEKLQGSLSRLDEIRKKKYVGTRMQTLLGQVDKAKQEYFNAVQRAKTRPEVDVATPRRRYKLLLDKVQAEQLTLDSNDTNPYLRIHSNSLTGQ